MATRPLLPTRSQQSNAEATQAKVFAQAYYYSSLSQPGALPVSGLNSGAKGFRPFAMAWAGRELEQVRQLGGLDVPTVSNGFACHLIPTE